MGPPLKPIHWIASAYDDLRRCPGEVQDDLGYALYIAQEGGVHRSAKPLKGFGGAGVLEIVDHHDGDTYRAVYTVKFVHAVYVLHVFQKKSKKGIQTPKADMELIRSRLSRAAADHDRRYRKEKP